MPVEVRRVRPQDWPAVRSLRIEALGDSPSAFVETLGEAAGYAESQWRQRAARGAVGGDSYQALAWSGGRAVGTAAAYLRDGQAWLVGVYLSPPYRGAGLLARLVEPAAAWVARQGVTRLLLQVHEDNGRAQAAYARLGFRPTGQRSPYPLDPRRDELVLVLPLAR